MKGVNTGVHFIYLQWEKTSKQTKYNNEKKKGIIERLLLLCICAKDTTSRTKKKYSIFFSPI